MWVSYSYGLDMYGFPVAEISLMAQQDDSKPPQGGNTSPKIMHNIVLCLAGLWYYHIVE